MLTYLHVFGIGLLIMSKIADVGIPETPTPLASANVGNGDTPTPLKHADLLNGWSLIVVILSKFNFRIEVSSGWQPMDYLWQF